jgi:hypothetical protein
MINEIYKGDKPSKTYLSAAGRINTLKEYFWKHKRKRKKCY